MEAVMLTEIYEYARNLSDPCFTLVDLQTFKFDLTVKMVDCGLIEKALLYIEQIATNIANDPSKYKKSFIEAVYVLGDRIKYHDPVYKDAIEDAANVMWLNKLAEIVGKYQDEQVVEDETYGSRTMIENQEIHEIKHQQQQSSQQQWNTIQPDYNDGPTSMMEVNTSEKQSDWQPLSLPTNIQDTYDSNAQYMRNVDESVQYQQLQQQDYWSQQPYYQNNYGRNESVQSNWQQQPTSGLTDQTEVTNSQQDKWNYEPAQPTISMTPSTGKQYDPLEELDALETPRSIAKSATDTKKTTEKTTEKKPSNNGGSWFGGLFSKLAPKPKNQMKLPDDSNPTIVWDPTVKKWMNKDEDGDNGTGTLAPPPKTADINFRAPAVERGPQPSLPSTHSEDTPAMDISKLPTGSNMFKLPKSRSMRAYVDIMNPGGKSKGSAASSNVATPMTSPLVPIATSSPQMFVPAPINDPTAPVDFLTSAATPPSGNVVENTPGPMMFNPSDMKDRSVKNMPPSRYHPR